KPTPSIANAALVAIESRSAIDPVNPPLSTLPPPLDLPTRNGDITFSYLWNLSRAYGGFYKEGVKAVWYNWRAARLLRERLAKEANVKDTDEAAMKGLLKRSEWQLLQRNDHDIGKLPLFGVMVLLFGEWLPLLVPFIPTAVPSTCRIPSQIRGMREKAEARRRVSFREGYPEPSKEQVVAAEESSAPWPTTTAPYVRSLLGRLRSDQLLHLSSTFDLHFRLWDWLQLPPSRFLMQRSLSKRLQYIAVDDRLLAQAGGAAKLTGPELERACEERGLDVLGRKDAVLRDNLTWWL
ncbi:hypothetical protein BAUCODRAFT_57834, partial [Baudoinia panamericana UAMH 10762]